MPKVVIDIETIGEDFDKLDKTTQEVLTRWIKREARNEEEYQVALTDIKEGLGFSPLTGEIVAIGLLNPESNKGKVYFQAPGEDIKHWEEQGCQMKPMTEKEMLQQFWKDAHYYEEFITFNGMSFDIPFILARSAVHKIRPSKDLMSNRYLRSQSFNAKHVDLLDQLSYYGAVRRRGSLHLWCRALGIKSPKAGGVCGDDVVALFKEKKYKEIAIYNIGDIVATKKLYDYWNDYLRF